MGFLKKANDMREDIDSVSGSFTETIETVKNIELGRFSDTKEPFYSIETHKNETVVLAANYVSLRIEEIRPEDKLKYLRSGPSIVVEIHDMEEHQIYKMNSLA